MSPSIVTSHDLGMIRIYMKPRDSGKPRTKGWFRRGAPLYRELVLAAKADGIMNAVAHHTHYGYSNHGIVHEEGLEIVNPELTMCVELICQRETLERFCKAHADVLQGKVIVFKPLEQWSVVPG